MTSSYDFLKKVELFAGLSDEDLDRLCNVVEEVCLSAGEELFAEGDPGDQAYVIKEGELEVIKKSVDRDVFLAIRKSGEVIGEMALLEDAPRSATIRCIHGQRSSGNTQRRPVPSPRHKLVGGTGAVFYHFGAVAEHRSSSASEREDGAAGHSLRRYRPRVEQSGGSCRPWRRPTAQCYRRVCSSQCRSRPTKPLRRTANCPGGTNNSGREAGNGNSGIGRSHS